MSAATSAPAASAGPDERLDPALIRLAAILLTGAIAPFLDTTIVNVAIESIGRGLHASVDTVQWVLVPGLHRAGPRPCATAERSPA